MHKIMVPIDGSTSALHAVKWLVAQLALYKESPEIHLLNVQRPFPGTVRGVHGEAEKYHHEEGTKALAAARKSLDDADVKYVHHIGVGEAAETIAHFVKDKQLNQVVMGTRGAGAVANMLLGSVATKVLHLVEVPVLLVK